MKKSKVVELDNEQIVKVIKIALEEKKPFELLKKEYGINEKEVSDLMQKKLSPDNYTLWKKKNAPKKPKPLSRDNFDDDLDGKYYIKNKLD